MKVKVQKREANSNPKAKKVAKVKAAKVAKVATVKLAVKREVKRVGVKAAAKTVVKGAAMAAKAAKTVIKALPVILPSKLVAIPAHDPKLHDPKIVQLPVNALPTEEEEPSAEELEQMTKLTVTPPAPTVVEPRAAYDG